MKSYAEQSPYWETSVHPAKSQGEIIELLESFGATAIITGQGTNSGRFAWLVRFQWGERSYRFVFTPLPLLYPGKVYTVSGKRLNAEDRARYQMGRIAMNFVKAVLTAAEMDPAALFGFLELPGARNHPGGMPFTAAELNVSGLVALLPDIVPTRLFTDGMENDHVG
jgi:hypothetical protein